MANIDEIFDKDGSKYTIIDNEDGTYDVRQFSSDMSLSTDKIYKASMMSCSCAGFKYRHTCKHHRWIIENEKSLYKKNFDYDKAEQLYKDLLGDIVKHCEITSLIADIAPGGSFARKSSVVRDLDLLIAIDDKEKINSLVQNASKIFEHVLSASDKMVRGIYKNGLQVDIHICPRLGFEAYHLFLTGNLWFTIKMKKKAAEAKYKLTEQGLFQWDEITKNHSITIALSEKDIFSKIGMEFVPVEKRYLTQEEWKNEKS